MVVLKLSISDVIVSQKGSNGDGKLHFFGRDYKGLYIYVLDTKEQSVRANNYTLSALKMFVRGNLLHCTKRA